jgi:hypothetical protein
VFEIDAARQADPDSAVEASDEALRRRLEQRHRFTLPEHAPFGSAAHERFDFTRTMTLDEVVAWLGTYSQVIVADPQDRDARLARVRTVLEEHAAGADTIEIPLGSECWRTDRLPR